MEDEEEEVIQQSLHPKKKNKNKQKYTGAWLADLAKDQDHLYQNLKKTKMAHVGTFLEHFISLTFLELEHF